MSMKDPTLKNMYASDLPMDRPMNVFLMMSSNFFGLNKFSPITFKLLI